MLQFPKNYGLGYGQKIMRNENGFKSPLLVVGANNYIRENTKPEILKAWDIHILFFPTSECTWRVGALYISSSNESTMLKVCEGINIENALKQCLEAPKNALALHTKSIAWLNMAVYRCNKIALKEVLELSERKEVGKIA
jgi:hypothetical protein